MRVLFDYQAFSIQPRGGISRYVLELARQLTAAGVEARVDAGWHRSELLRPPPPEVTGRFVRHVPRTSPLRHFCNRWRTRGTIARWRPDIVHETYFRAGAAYAAGIPTILTVHDLTYFVLPQAQREAGPVRQAQVAAVQRADHVICVSETTKADLLRFIPISPERVSVVLQGGPQAPFASDTTPPLHRPYLLHVGLRNSYKNFGVLVTAFAASALRRAGGCLAAFGGGEFTAAERAHWRAQGLPDEQLVYHRGDDAALARHYRHAIAYVCPSLYEGFGLPVIEAMVHDCVVLCSNRGALPEVAGNAALFFEPTDPGNLTALLDRIVASPSETAVLRARGREQAARFSWARCGRETLAAYRRVLG